MNEMVKPQVLQFWGFYQHSTSLLYVHLHTNWKTKKRTDVQLLSKQQKKAPNKAYQYSESVSHLSVSELPPPSPRHILRPPSFPRPAESSRSAGLLLPTLPSHRRCPPRRAAPAGRQRARVPRGKWAKAAQPRRGELAGWHRPGWPRGRNYKVCLCWMVLFSCPGPVYGTGAGFGLRWEMLNTGPVGFWGPGVERNEKRDRNTGSKTREAQGSGEGQGGWSGSGLRGRREEESIRGNKRG